MVFIPAYVGRALCAVRIQPCDFTHLVLYFLHPCADILFFHCTIFSFKKTCRNLSSFTCFIVLVAVLNQKCVVVFLIQAKCILTVQHDNENKWNQTEC